MIYDMYDHSMASPILSVLILTIITTDVIVGGGSVRSRTI